MIEPNQFCQILWAVAYDQGTILEQFYVPPPKKTSHQNLNEGNCFMSHRERDTLTHRSSAKHTNGQQMKSHEEHAEFISVE